MDTPNSKELWTLKEAKAHLPQILRLAEVDGPQYINASQTEMPQIEGHKTFVIVPAQVWNEKNPPKKPLGQRLLDLPRGVGVKEPEYDEGGRYIAFSDIVFDEEE